MKLEIVPVSIKEAQRFVELHHRHHPTAHSHLFAVGVSDGEQIRGAAIIGRPVARMLCDGWTAEVVRVVTDGCPNACSALYGAAWRACKALGYKRLITYTLPEEGGASLRGAGWHCIGEKGGGSWSRKSRPRMDLHPTQVKLRWEKS
jgi:hypothetical protein